MEVRGTSGAMAQSGWYRRSECSCPRRWGKGFFVFSALLAEFSVVQRIRHKRIYGCIDRRDVSFHKKPKGGNNHGEHPTQI